MKVLVIDRYGDGEEIDQETPLPPGLVWGDEEYELREGNVYKEVEPGTSSFTRRVFDTKRSFRVGENCGD